MRLEFRRRERLLQVVLAVIGLLLTARYASSTWRRRDPWDVVYPYKNGVLTDFRDTVMLPWRAIEAGVNPYDIQDHTRLFPYAQEFDPYAPWWLSATHPFALLGWDTAALLYSVTSAVVIGGCAVVAGRWVAGEVQDSGLGEVAPSAWTLAGAMLVLVWVWRPTAIGHGLGNVGAIAALWAVLALMARRGTLGAVFMALAWVKPQFGIPVVLILLVRGQWRRAALGTGLAGLASLPMFIRLSGIAGGPVDLVRSVLESVSELGRRTGGEPMSGRIDLARALGVVGVPTNSLLLLGVGCTLVLVAARCGRGLTRSGRPGMGLLLVSVATLLGFPHLHYDLPMLLPPIVWAGCEVVGRMRETGGLRPSESAVVTALGILTVVCVLPRGLFAVSLTIWQSFALVASVIVSAVALCAVVADRPLASPSHQERQ